MLLAITLGAIVLLAVNGGIKFGIDFSGGLRIPVLLENPVDSVTMESMVQTIKTRATTFGLTEVKVRPVGDSAIYVEVPQSNPGMVKQIESVLSHQGVYQGIVDGKVAITGEDLYEGTIRRVYSNELQGADWGVGFSVRREGQMRFSRVVKGKADYPLYMFIDRPNDSIVIVSRTDLLYNANTSRLVGLSEDAALKAGVDALALDGSDVPVFLSESLAAPDSTIPKPASNHTKALISKDAPESLKARLNASGYVLSEQEPKDMRPRFSSSRTGTSYVVSEWAAIGLKSAPLLNAGVTEGLPSSGYTISGAADGTGSARTADAEKKAREMESILKGGALPVQISIGSTVEIPAPLGEEFKRLSVIGAAFALFCISALVAFRYRTMKVVLPIVLISISEMIILVAIIGSFSIDLAAMAGIIAAIGVSVDAQIVVTDELLKHKSAGGMEQRLEGAFDIIVTNVIVACVAMLPLLFSGLVEIIGFATSSVLGSLLGLFITRPAYGAIVERLFEGDAKAA